MSAPGGTGRPAPPQTSAIVVAPRASPARVGGFVVLLAAVSWALGAFAAWPWAANPADAARLRISLKHVTAYAQAADAGRVEDLARLPAHMRPRGAARRTSGRRLDARLTVTVDGRAVLARIYRPTGLRRDGPVYAYEEVAVSPGRHRVAVTLAEGTAEHALVRDLDVLPGRAPLFEHEPARGWRSE